MRFSQNSSRVTAALAISLLAGALLACNLSKGTLSPKSMFDGAAMTDAGAALKQKLGGPFKVLDVQINRDSVRLRVQDPKKPGNVDEYHYRPALKMLSAPSPVELSSLENNLDNTLFDFDSVNWSAIESLARAALERTQIDGGKIDKITVERNLAIGDTVTKSGGVQLTVEISNSREHATAYADTQGRITKLDLSHTMRAAKFNLLTAEALREAVSQIDAEWGGSAMVMDIQLWNKSLRFKAPDPKTKEISQYFYDINGVNHDVILDIAATDQDVRRIQGDHKIEEILFPLNSIKLDQAPELGDRAIQRLGFENAHVESIHVKRVERDETSKLVTFWEINCQAGRKWGVVTYDLNGRELGVNTQ